MSKIINIDFFKKNIFWIYLIFGSLIYAISGLSIFIYSAVFYLIISIISTAFRKKSAEKLIIDLLLCSLMVPDNFIVVAVALCLLIYKMFTKKFNKCQPFEFVLIIFISISLILNLFLGSLHLLNIMMSLVYLLPFFAYAVFFKDIFNRKTFDNDYILLRLRYFIGIQYLTVVVWALTHFRTMLSYADLDWVTGTFGKYQCNVLMCACSFTGIVFLCQYFYYKYAKDLLYATLSFALAMCTGSFIYMCVMLIALALVLFTSRKIKGNTKLVFLFVISVLVALFLVCSPSWMVQEVKSLFDFDYLRKRVVKIDYYYNTFIKFPQEEGLIRFLFGIGPGEYTSRASETCAGGYISFYDKLFAGYQNPLREKYISVIAELHKGEGLASTPMSSILSITGEYGFIGLVLLIVFFGKKYLRVNPFAKLSIMFFLGLMFFDNALEFPKYVLALWSAYYCCLSIERSYKQARERREQGNDCINYYSMLQRRKNN